MYALCIGQVIWLVNKVRAVALINKFGIRCECQISYCFLFYKMTQNFKLELMLQRAANKQKKCDKLPWIIPLVTHVDDRLSLISQIIYTDPVQHNSH